MQSTLLALLAPEKNSSPLKSTSSGEFLAYKSSPNGAWKPWQYHPPTRQTLEILKRESETTHNTQRKRYLELKREGKKPSFPVPHCMFYGEFVYSYLWAKGREWNVEDGWIKE